MNEFESLYRTPILPTLLVLALGLGMGFRWLHRDATPGLRDAAVCTLLGIPLAYLGFVVAGETLVRPQLFMGLLVAMGLTANALAFAIGTRRETRKGPVAAALGLAIAALPALCFVLPNAVHRGLHWHPGYWLTLGWIRAHTDDVRAAAMPLDFPATWDGSYVLAPVLLLTLLAWYLDQRVKHHELLAR